MSKLKLLELFGGIGACSKALEQLGIDFEIVDYVDNDKFAVRSFNAIHDSNFEVQDITQWDKQIDVDLIMHGSPCQDFSLAGLQAGGDEGSGTRSSLMYETLRIVEKLKPKYVIWENVKNVISKKHKHNFDNYCNKMSELGYENYSQVLNAKDYGIPQNRERVFTISIRKDIDNGFIFPPKQELQLRLKDMLEDNVDEKYYLNEQKIKAIANWKAYQKPFEKVQGKNSIVPTLTARGAGEEHSGMITYSDLLNETTNLQNQCLNFIGTFQYAKSDAFMNGKNRLQIDKKLSDTLQTTQKEGIVSSDLRIRKLTPKESWRLMGFDDEDFEKASKVCSDNQLYKQAGNSIVVNVLENILKELL